MKLLRLTAFILATLIFLLAIGCSSTEVPKEHPEDGKPNENEDESKNESSDPKEESKMTFLSNVAVLCSFGNIIWKWLFG